MLNIIKGVKDLNLQEADTFSDIALKIFRYQYIENPLYRAYVDGIHTDMERVFSIEDIPFLPISFFKSHIVKTGNWSSPEAMFESSGTTDTVPSLHHVRDVSFYEALSVSLFTDAYGDIEDYTIVALLPSYLERSTSSLVHMVKHFMSISAKPDKGFYLHNYKDLYEKLNDLMLHKRKVLLIGVTFALLDFAGEYPMTLHNVVVMETGGMKGRREEWTRHQVHTYLKEKFNLPSVHSEYGMTELLSQAYSKADGIFQPSATLRALVRDINDPLSTSSTGTGALNIIDLGNIHSCCFIATDDVGTVQSDGSFTVGGRIDHSALRGCSLMVV